MRGLIDTSIFIAEEAGRPIGQLPDEGAISVITIAELHLGVLHAGDGRTRAQRLATLTRAERDFEALAIDSEVARVFASILDEAAAKGRRPKVMDVWIAATAVHHRLVLFSQDADFDGLPQVTVQRI